MQLFPVGELALDNLHMKSDAIVINYFWTVSTPKIIKQIIGTWTGRHEHSDAGALKDFVDSLELNAEYNRFRFN